MSLTLNPRTFTRAFPTDETTDQRYTAACGSLHKRWNGHPLLLAELERSIPDMPELVSLTDCAGIKIRKLGRIESQFKSFNMAREYTLVLVCGLQCGGEKCKGVFKVEGFQILQPQDQGKFEERNEEIPKSAQEEEEGEEEEEEAVVFEEEEEDENEGEDREDREGMSLVKQGVEVAPHKGVQVAQTVSD